MNKRTNERTNAKQEKRTSHFRLASTSVSSLTRFCYVFEHAVWNVILNNSFWIDTNSFVSLLCLSVCLSLSFFLSFFLSFLFSLSYTYIHTNKHTNCTYMTQFDFYFLFCFQISFVVVIVAATSAALISCSWLFLLVNKCFYRTNVKNNNNFTKNPLNSSTRITRFLNNLLFINSKKRVSFYLIFRFIHIITKMYKEINSFNMISKYSIHICASSWWKYLHVFHFLEHIRTIV